MSEERFWNLTLPEWEALYLRYTAHIEREAASFRSLAFVVARVAGDRELMDILQRETPKRQERPARTLDDTEAFFKAWSRNGNS